MSQATVSNQSKYHTAKLWQIALFALNNTATNLYLFMIGFVAYYATGIAGLTVVIVSSVIGLSRLFDAITDPIIGFIIDKTETRFGKFRPLMLVGNVILAGSVIIMYGVTHTLPDAMQLPFFILVYVIYIIGYTIQTTCTRAAQTILTNDPAQRPTFSVFDATYSIGLFTGGQIFIASYLIGKHGDFTLALFNELNAYGIALSFIFTVLAVIALGTKDRKEFYGLADSGKKTRFRDFWPILKGNRPLQMLVIAASTDKIAALVLRQPAVFIMFFGIVLGDYALSGTVSLISIIPSLLITFLGVRLAAKTDLKNALVKATWVGIITASILVVYFLLIDPQTISLSNLGLITISFLIFYSLIDGITKLTPAIVIPMIADVSDYETAESGRYVPGMIGALFSFVDKLMSSLAPVIVGVVVAMIGYQDSFPQLGDALTTPLLIASLFLMFGIPILAWTLTLIAMKFYKLDRNKMNEIQETIAEAKAKAKAEKDQAAG